MVEFTTGGIAYRTGRLNAFQQWEIARRLGPVLPDILAAFSAFMQPDGFEAGIAHAGTALAKINDADSKHIFNLCLSAATRQVSNEWAAVALPDGRLMYQDITLPEVIGITARTIADNLGGFIPALSSDLASALRAFTSRFASPTTPTT